MRTDGEKVLDRLSDHIEECMLVVDDGQEYIALYTVQEAFPEGLMWVERYIPGSGPPGHEESEMLTVEEQDALQKRLGRDFRTELEELAAERATE